MTEKNYFTDQAFTTLFDVMDLSYLYAARLSLFAPGALMAHQQHRQIPVDRREARTGELADVLGDF